MRLINLDKLLEELDKEVKLADDWKTAHELYNVVKYFPTVDSCADCKEAYDRPKGEWIKEDKPWGGFGDSVLVLTCSECGESFVYHGNAPKFCSECGADMRGDTE